MLRTRALALCAVAVAILGIFAISAHTASAPISLSSSRQTIKSSQSVDLTGTVVHPPTVGHVVLYRAYPGGPERRIATTAVTADGAFFFTQFPDRDTTYFVRLEGRPATARVTIDVDGR